MTDKADIDRKQLEADEEYRRLAANHERNEDARDRFFPLSHTAILASSIAFLGQINDREVSCIGLVILAWVSSGLAMMIAAFSYFHATAYIEYAIEQLHSSDEDKKRDPKLYSLENQHKKLSLAPALLLIPSVLGAVSFSIINVWR